MGDSIDQTTHHVHGANVGRGYRSNDMSRECAGETNYGTHTRTLVHRSTQSLAMRFSQAGTSSSFEQSATENKRKPRLRLCLSS